MSSRAAELSKGAFALRWIVLSVLAFAFAIGCVFFGRWQWTRTYDILESERAQLAAPIDVALATSTDPGASAEEIGRNVFAIGKYDPARQVFITNRTLGNDVGVWVVSALELGDGSSVPVLRGWLPSATSPGAQPPSGQVTVTGLVTPYEKFYAGADPKVPVSMSVETLRTPWGPLTRDGIVWLTAQDPSSGPAPTPVPPSVVLADVPFPWQNFFYAFQWWVFAVFAIVLWARWLIMELRARREPNCDEAASTTVGTS